jgi:hypothetical protein
MFNPSLFKSLLPASFFKLIQVAHSHSLVPAIIGGIVRDYLNNGMIGNDFDIELTSEVPKDLERLFDQFISQLKQNYQLKEHDYRVFTLELEGIEFEFTMPRHEKYNLEKGHKNFSVIFADKGDQENCKRRDFTINAIMVRFFKDGDIQLIDPYDGHTHLLNKQLVACSDDFVQDPLRLIRAYRFKEKLGFNFSPALKEGLKDFKIPLEISHYHLKKELIKSHHFFQMYREVRPFLKSDYPRLSTDFDQKHSDPLIDLFISDENFETKKQFCDVFGESLKRYRSLHEVISILKILKKVEFTFDFSEFLQRDDLTQGSLKLFKNLDTVSQTFGDDQAQSLLQADQKTFLRMKNFKDPRIEKMPPQARSLFINYHKLKVLYENQIF